MLLIRLHWTMFVNYPRRRRQSKAFNRVWTHAITRHIHSMNFIRSVRCPGNLLIGLHWLKCLKIPSTWGFVGLCHMSQSYDPSDAKRIFSSDMPPNMCWVVAMVLGELGPGQLGQGELQPMNCSTLHVSQHSGSVISLRPWKIVGLLLTNKHWLIDWLRWILKRGNS